MRLRRHVHVKVVLTSSGEILGLGPISEVLNDPPEFAGEPVCRVHSRWTTGHCSLETIMPSSCQDISKLHRFQCCKPISDYVPRTLRPQPSRSYELTACHHQTGEALAQCLQESDCIMVQRHSPRECLASPLAEELPMKCQQLRKGFSECK
jgi:hypothetical protein